MKASQVEENIDHYMPSQDEILLAEDALHLICLKFHCFAEWQDLKEMYARLPYGAVAMAIWEEEDGTHYTHAWAQIDNATVKISIGLNILEVVETQTYTYDKPFEHGELVKEKVNFEQLQVVKKKPSDKEEINDWQQNYYDDSEQQEEEDDFDTRFNALFYGNSDEEEEEEEKQPVQEERPDRIAEFIRDMQYAKSFKEQFGTDSTEITEETASTKLMFGMISDMLGL